MWRSTAAQENQIHFAVLMLGLHSRPHILQRHFENQLHTQVDLESELWDPYKIFWLFSARKFLVSVKTILLHCTTPIMDAPASDSRSEKTDKQKACSFNWLHLHICSYRIPGLLAKNRADAIATEADLCYASLYALGSWILVTLSSSYHDWSCKEMRIAKVATTSSWRLFSWFLLRCSWWFCKTRFNSQNFGPLRDISTDQTQKVTTSKAQSDTHLETAHQLTLTDTNLCWRILSVLTLPHQPHLQMLKKAQHNLQPKAVQHVSCPSKCNFPDLRCSPNPQRAESSSAFDAFAVHGLGNLHKQWLPHTELHFTAHP